MKIGIASDHHGINQKSKIKEFLTKKGYEVIDYGPATNDMVDFPPFAFSVAEDVANSKISLGILLCGTGIGMSIAANKVKGVRCAKISNVKEARLSKEHNNANVLAFGSTLSFGLIKRMLNAYLQTNMNSNERYQRRNDMIDHYGE